MECVCVCSAAVFVCEETVGISLRVCVCMIHVCVFMSARMIYICFNKQLCVHSQSHESFCVQMQTEKVQSYGLSVPP